ncbi:Growth inhibition and differentiation-related protein 88 like [Cinnamomum micranthum f. kanehirae]|uniref:Growth inhibition and differentiation-related protein 88 like n=1 Tax=Cinnamomum micranthum f. kanehirae TaxID=337451 RepID=A0A443NYN8_9MAGN|nr:Growth inhibition and differentiation-related protein 88 like [Cinnamomum micranthum f. kanehirae]
MEEAKERKEEERQGDRKEEEGGGGGGGGENWSSAVEDLVDRGDIDGAISLLESLISKLKTLEKTSNLPLASALFDLANLYSSRGLSLKADELRNRALVIKLRSQLHDSRPLGLGDSNSASEAVRKNDLEESRSSATGASPSLDNNDDWEAIADLASNELLPPQVEAGVSNITLEDIKVQAPKRRGRGSFLYKKNGLYSDQAADGAPIDNSEDELSGQYPKEDADIRNSRYGMSHVLVLADFPPSTRTTDLEKVFEKFRDQGVVIRWVNDTVALAVFRNPSIDFPKYWKH